LTLTLSVAELPVFYLQFRIRAQMDLWKTALQNIHDPNPPQTSPIPPPSRGHGAPPQHEYDVDHSGTDDDEYKTNPAQRLSSVNSSVGAAKSYQTAPTEYSNQRGAAGGFGGTRFPQNIRVPLDIVVVIPVSVSMQALKITVLKDSLRFLVSNLGERDRMGLVTFGSSPGGVPVVQMTGKNWHGWNRTLESIRPIGQKNFRADVVEGANVAMDLLMQRQYANPLASILLISDSSTSDAESVDFVVQRAEAAK
jgi:Mg-chelatase subunit ChlD